jgi:thioredoxin-dependent peroxiredoxin
MGEKTKTSDFATSSSSSSSSATVTKPNKMPSAGDSAPDFSFSDMQGNSIKLSDLRTKKKVVLYFYPKDFTPGCSTEATEFTREYKKFRNAGIEIIGVSPDDEDSHRKFREKMGIPYLLASDVKTEISRMYGAYGPKSFMGKEYEGVNRSTFLIDKNGIIIRVFDKVKPLGHSEEVLKAFENS